MNQIDRRSKGVSTFMATMILVSISLTLSYVVYEGVSRISPPAQEVFTNQETTIGGVGGLVHITVTASSADSPLDFLAGNASSSNGILYFDGTEYGTTQRLCLAGATTFFDVYTTSGDLSIQSNGASWVDGGWTNGLVVTPGWHEIMFTDSTTCSIVLPDGTAVVYPGRYVSSIPLIGTLPSDTFDLYVPGGSLTSGPFVLVFDGGYDRIA